MYFDYLTMPSIMIMIFHHFYKEYWTLSQQLPLMSFKIKFVFYAMITTNLEKSIQSDSNIFGRFVEFDA